MSRSQGNTLQIYDYPATHSPSMSQSQGNIYPISELQNNFNQSRNGFLDQPSQTETDERSLQSQVISHQREEPNNVYNKEWIENSIQEGSIHCYQKSDIDMRSLPIAGGAYGAVFEATMKHNRLAVAIKTLYRKVHSCEEKFYKKLVKEVGR